MECESKYDPTVHLSYADVAVDNTVFPTAFSIQIKASKMDQFRKGFKAVIGSTKDDLLPVAALMSYLNLRGDDPGPLFHWDNQIPVSFWNKSSQLSSQLTSLLTCMQATVSA